MHLINFRTKPRSVPAWRCRDMKKIIPIEFYPWKNPAVVEGMRKKAGGMDISVSIDSDEMKLRDFLHYTCAALQHDKGTRAAEAGNVVLSSLLLQRGSPAAIDFALGHERGHASAMKGLDRIAKAVVEWIKGMDDGPAKKALALFALPFARRVETAADRFSVAMNGSAAGMHGINEFESLLLKEAAIRSGKPSLGERILLNKKFGYQSDPLLAPKNALERILVRFLSVFDIHPFNGARIRMAEKAAGALAPEGGMQAP